MLGTDFRSRRSHESGKGGDELPGLIQVLEFLCVLLGGQAKLHGRGAHEVNSGRGDDLDGGNFCDVADLLRDIGLRRGRLVNV